MAMPIIDHRGPEFRILGERVLEGIKTVFKTSGPVYVGIGFTSHLAANVLTAKVADVVVENKAGQVK